jgi:antitoxin VapB
MALSIKNETVDRLARDLAEITGESITEAISRALEERLERETGKKRVNLLRDEINYIRERIARLPRLDNRSDDDIIGYDESGLPERSS